jgi:hypothetical protein
MPKGVIRICKAKKDRQYNGRETAWRYQRGNHNLVLQILITPLLSSSCFSSIVLSVLLRFTDSDYPFGIFKLFFWKLIKQNNRCTIFRQDKLLWLTVISNNTEKTMTTAPIFCCFKPQKIEFIFLDIDQNDKQRSTKHTHKLKIE